MPIKEIDGRLLTPISQGKKKNKSQRNLQKKNKGMLRTKMAMQPTNKMVQNQK